MCLPRAIGSFPSTNHQGLPTPEYTGFSYANRIHSPNNRRGQVRIDRNCHGGSPRRGPSPKNREQCDLAGHLPGDRTASPQSITGWIAPAVIHAKPVNAKLRVLTRVQVGNLELAEPAAPVRKPRRMKTHSQSRSLARRPLTRLYPGGQQLVRDVLHQSRVPHLIPM
jgi:hypothetical protein